MIIYIYIHSIHCHIVIFVLHILYGNKVTESILSYPGTKNSVFEKYVDFASLHAAVES